VTTSRFGDTELVVSGLPPVGMPLSTESGYSWNGLRNFRNVWLDEAGRSSGITLLSGYISNDSVAEIQSLVENSPAKLKLSLCVGMAKFEGLTLSQLSGLKKLHGFLEANQRGSVVVVSPWKFHGKLTIFESDSGDPSVLLGSSNISALSLGANQYECDVLLRGQNEVSKLQSFAQQLLSEATEPLESVPIVSSRSTALEEFLGVVPLSDRERSVRMAQAASTDVRYEMPLKAGIKVGKSNLNSFFGKGRTNKQKTLVIPRPWYEVEIMPGRDWYRASEYFPKAGLPFTVTTDDGFVFKCYSSYDQAWDGAKNFRSYRDLQILGRWIKGRLEASGCLEPGEPITDKTLRCYGRSSITFSRLSEPEQWYADFSTEKSPRLVV